MITLEENYIKPWTAEEIRNYYRALNLKDEDYPMFEAKYNRVLEEVYEEDGTVEESAHKYWLRTAEERVREYHDLLDQGYSEVWANRFSDLYEDDRRPCCVFDLYRELHESEPEQTEKDLLKYAHTVMDDDVFAEELLKGFNERDAYAEEYCKLYAERYRQALRQGKTEEFARLYARGPVFDSDRDDLHWLYTEKYFEKIGEGKDEEYAAEYAEKYADQFAGETPDTDPDILEFWKAEVTAYINGWDYRRKNNLDERFLKVYEHVYMNECYTDTPERTPWDDFDNYVLRKAVDAYNQEMERLSSQKEK